MSQVQALYNPPYVQVAEWHTRWSKEPVFCGFKSHLGYQRWQYDNLPLYASVAESADAPDLKSGVRDGVRVQFPSEAPCRGVAQLVEQRSPKPCCVCSSRIIPAICEWSRTVRVRTANPSKAGSTPVVRSKSALCISTQGRFLFFVRLKLRLAQKRLKVKSG